MAGLEIITPHHICGGKHVCLNQSWENDPQPTPDTYDHMPFGAKQCTGRRNKKTTTNHDKSLCKIKLYIPDKGCIG
jgi:hypothetical protein